MLQHSSKLLFFFLSSFFLFSCSSAKRAFKREYDSLLNHSALQSAHTGIFVFDATTRQTLLDYQGNKYFTPASNTKLFSLYTGLKCLGDSLIGIRYWENDTALFLLPAGDPTLLHPDYHTQPVIDFLRGKRKNIYINETNWKEQPWGSGWSWDDYNDDYMAERSALPVYGNTITWAQTQVSDGSYSVFSIPDVNWKLYFSSDLTAKYFFVRRRLAENIFDVTQGLEKYKEQQVPFVTNGLMSAVELLKDTVGKNIFIQPFPPDIDHSKFTILRSQPADSMYRPMMWRSDNFFAEQTLLMSGNEKLGVMNEQKIIDTILKTDLKDLPQKPEWVDGSGLSRYNLFTPQDFVWLLNKMKDEFGLQRMKDILPTGGSGTLGKRYEEDSSYLYAKTGSLSGVAALSGYLITTRNHLLIFSILVNNYPAGGSQVRDAMAQIVAYLRRKY